MDEGVKPMENQEKKGVAKRFAALFAGVLGETLESETGTAWPFEPVELPGRAMQKEVPVHYRLCVEGSRKGECFVELCEAHLLAIVSGMEKQPVTALNGEHFEKVAKIILACAEKMASAHGDEYGDLRFQVDRVSGLAFGGMYVVPLSVKGEDSDKQVLLYFGGQLMDALAFGNRAPDHGDEPEMLVHPHNLQMVMDVELSVSLRFGQRMLQLREVLDLASGSVVELDRMVDEPVELFLDGRLIARGEAVVVDGNYGFRVTEIPQPLASHFLN